MASVARQPNGLIARKKGTFMKSRLALISVLALGVFMSGTGATLAVSGISSSGSASSAQYPPEEHEKEEHLCENGSGSGNGSESGSNGSGCNHESEHCGPVSSGGNGEACETQEVRQVESSSGGSLPFTGFLAIPVLIVGVGLLGAGVAMRMRMRSGDHPA
jgi:hypothetical protein